jgi:ATP-dependent Clp protease ATP-binding subunit ClpA
VDKFIEELRCQLIRKKVKVVLSDESRDWLADKGYDVRYGARPLARLVQTEIKDALSEEVLFGRLKKGGTVHIGLKDNRLDFNYT